MTNEDTARSLVQTWGTQAGIERVKMSDAIDRMGRLIAMAPPQTIEEELSAELEKIRDSHLKIERSGSRLHRKLESLGLRARSVDSEMGSVYVRTSEIAGEAHAIMRLLKAWADQVDLGRSLLKIKARLVELEQEDKPFQAAIAPPPSEMYG